jgi:hypothetical protein
MPIGSSQRLAAIRGQAACGHGPGPPRELIRHLRLPRSRTRPRWGWAPSPQSPAGAADLFRLGFIPQLGLRVLAVRPASAVRLWTLYRLGVAWYKGPRLCSPPF